MFKENKYNKWYYKIINNAKSLNRSKGAEYFENHHILPKCMGGSNHHSNLVLLTPREHFICHLLLTKFVNENYKYKMAISVNIMIHDNFNPSRKFTSREYNYARKYIIESLKLPKSKESIIKGIETRKRNNKKVSIETKKKMSEKRKGLIHISNIDLKQTKMINEAELNSYIEIGWVKGRLFGIKSGKRHSEEQKKKWSEERKGSKQPKISEKRKGMVQAIDLNGIRHYVSKEEFDKRDDLFGIRNSKVAHLV
jgi:hypothetical protein